MTAPSTTASVDTGIEYRTTAAVANAARISAKTTSHPRFVTLHPVLSLSFFGRRLAKV